MHLHTKKTCFYAKNVFSNFFHFLTHTPQYTVCHILYNFCKVPVCVYIERYLLKWTWHTVYCVIHPLLPLPARSRGKKNLIFHYFCFYASTIQKHVFTQKKFFRIFFTFLPHATFQPPHADFIGFLATNVEFKAGETLRAHILV